MSTERLAPPSASISLTETPGRRRPRRDPASAVAYFLGAVMVGTTIPNALWGLFQADLGLSTTSITLVFAAYAVAIIVTLVAFGATSDRRGRRPVLMAAFAVSATASVVSLVDGVVPLVGGRVLAGVSVGLASGAAVAFITDLRGEGGAGRADLLATGATMAGLAAGPLLAGVIAEVGIEPTRLPFVAHLVLLGPALIALRAPETVQRLPRDAVRSAALALPAARRAFAGAALTGFTANAQLGLLAALAPTFLVDSLGLDSIVLGGLVGALLFASAGVGQIATAGVEARVRVVVGMGLVPVASVVLVFALTSGSLALFLAATAVGGLAGGLGFSGGLGVATSLARPADRSAVASTWFVATYLGLVFPVVGAGRLVETFGARTATVAFGATMTALAALATFTSRRDRTRAVTV